MLDAIPSIESFSQAVLSRMDAAWSYDRGTGRYRDEKENS